jgi:hypothetical protein
MHARSDVWRHIASSGTAELRVVLRRKSIKTWKWNLHSDVLQTRLPTTTTTTNATATSATTTATTTTNITAIAAAATANASDGIKPCKIAFSDHHNASYRRRWL